MNWKNKTILLTGGTGSFGKKFTEILLRTRKPKVVRIFSRDELKQWEMEKKFGGDKRLRFLLGDIRNADRLHRAMEGVDIVVHAAALKQVPACEYNPFEAVMTNVIGGENIINSALDHNVEKVLAISTDKAVNPVNLYGATKMCMEKLFVAANHYAGNERPTRMACARYGNVVGSRGSVIPVFKAQRDTGKLTLTDPRMTRFWLTLDQGVEFVIRCIENMHGGEVFVPKIPSMKMTELAKAIAPECRVKVTGIRPGEKLHECLLTEDESRHAIDLGKHFVILPEGQMWGFKGYKGGKKLPEGFRYASDNNTEWLTGKQLLKMI
ncbi:MAG TPA: UDP-N-acetylglucosamine 4,6-dehydratase (inverting) [Elusimicrobia bacterium]|nr:UDP-N-acetylglucosamine 4,6-dehydratase (inverting) [Elusimicrobiota bacterium]